MARMTLIAATLSAAAAMLAGCGGEIPPITVHVDRATAERLAECGGDEISVRVTSGRTVHLEGCDGDEEEPPKTRPIDDNKGGGTPTTRGPGYTDDIAQALRAINSLDAQTSKLRPNGAFAECISAGTYCDADRSPTVGLANAGLTHPGNLNWVRPSQVNVRNLVGTFTAVTGRDYTSGGWGEWSYFYTTVGSQDNVPGGRVRTSRHGQLDGGGGCNPSCHAQYVLTQRNGLVYQGLPTGTATYNGYTYAAVVRATNSGAISSTPTVLGDATIRAHFNTRTLDATFDNFRSSGSVPQELWNGVRFSNIRITNGSGRFLDDSTNRCNGCGKYISGSFYGPNNEELAGTYAVEDHVPSQRHCVGNSFCRTGHVIAGSFGGKRQ